MSNENLPDVTKQIVQQQIRNKLGCLVLFVAFVVLAVLFWFWCIYTPPLRFSVNTTYVISPTTADGKWINYFKALEESCYPPEMQTDDNGYRVFVRDCGFILNAAYNTEPVRLQVYEKLGIDPNVAPTLKFESSYTFFERLANESGDENKRQQVMKRRYELLRKPMFTTDDSPEFKTWLDENNAGLDLLGKAVRKPTFQMPYTVNTETHNTFSDIMLIYRDMAVATQERAKFRIGIGDVDGAIYDIITIHRLARFVSQNRIIMGNSLAGLAINGVANAIGFNANREHPATKEQIEHYLKELDALPPMPTFEQAVSGERLLALLCLQEVYAGDKVSKEILGSSVLTEHFANSLFYRFSDPNESFILFNKWYDMANDGDVRTNAESDVMFNFSKNPLSYILARSRSVNCSKILASRLISGFVYKPNAFERDECSANIKRLTLALLLYEKTNGKLPDGDWQTAVKPYLGDEPDKYFSCPHNNDYIYAMVKDGNDLLLVEVSKSQINASDMTVPNEKNSFGFPHFPVVSNAGYRSGSVKIISSTQTVWDTEDGM
ncbi:MAG: hypothetical protein LBU65_10655 [Planctomycetaceae bacterium]|jgi:hypothetical protein|nr:hypothetical protein [Planctomycetaceae bacterium]